MRIATIVCTLFLSGTLFAGVPGWRALQRLSTPLTGHGVTMVHTGDVLVVGGTDASGSSVADVWVIRGATGQRVQALSNLSVARSRFAIVTVINGSESLVYVIGGYTGRSGAYASLDVVDVIRYDAGQNNWRCSPSGTLPVAVGDARAVYDGLSNIVVSGGIVQATGALGSGAASLVSSSITSSTGSIRRLGDHIAARWAHGTYRFLDPTNVWRVLVAGGEAVPPVSAELLAGTSWDGRANPPRIARRFMADVSDISGTARAFGGEDAGASIATTEWYDPKSGWRQAPRMNQARSRMGVTLVAGPTDTASAYLVVAGIGTGLPTATTELFMMPSTSAPAGSFDVFYPTQQAASFRGVAMSGVNLPFVIGGGPSDVVEILQPLTAPDVTFPNTEVGARSDSVNITITNTWLLPITIKNIRAVGAPDFLVASDTSTIILAPGQSRKILGWFRPTQQGLRVARLALDMGPVADTILLQGNGLASTIALITDVVDHADVVVGSSSRLCLPILVNNGSDTAIVDSIVVPAGAGVVIDSPRGRTKVAPGDTLVVCVLYSPGSRSTLSTSGLISIGARRYPFAIIGRGIRTTGVVLVGVTCDTVSATRGDTVGFTVTLENVADRPIVITAISIGAAVAGSAWIADPTILPLTINPGIAVPLDILVEVQREGLENYAVRCVSNSDSAMENVACVVTRSRTLVPSVGSFDIGTVCLGDTVVRRFAYTNVSVADTIFVTSIDLENVGGRISRVAPFSVPPRSSVSVEVFIGPAVVGTVSGRVSVATALGSSVVPITGTVLPAVTIRPSGMDAVPGDRRKIRVVCEGVVTTRTVFTLVHSVRMFSILAITSAAGSTQALPTSTVTTTVNGSSVAIDWAQVPPGGMAEIALDVDVLRGDEAYAGIYAIRAGNTSDCILSDTAIVRIDTGCGGERSGIRLSSQPSIAVMPIPVREQMHVLVHLPENSMRLELVDVHGNVVATELLNTTSTSVVVDCSSLPRGLVIARLVSDRGLHHAIPVVIAP